jgi:hypothetical protein
MDPGGTTTLGGNLACTDSNGQAVLHEAWRRNLEGAIASPLMADTSGNLFFIERTLAGDAWFLTSVAPDGAPRFRTSIPPVTEPMSESYVAAVGEGVIFLGSHTSAAAYDPAGGHLIWNRSVASELTDDLDRYFVNAIAVAPGGNPIFSFGALGPASEQYPNSFVFALDAADGSERWKVQVIAANIAVDAAGNTYIDDYSTFSILSLDPAGHTRWVATQQAALHQTAVVDGLVFGESIFKDDGTLSEQLSDTQPLITAYISGGAGFLTYFLNNPQGPDSALAPLRLGSGQAPQPLASGQGLDRNAPILLADGRLLLNAKDVLQFYSQSGVDSCNLAADGAGAEQVGMAILTGGRYTTFVGSAQTLVSFEAPGLDAAAHGWITLNGSFARNGRAR